MPKPPHKYHQSHGEKDSNPKTISYNIACFSIKYWDAFFKLDLLFNRHYSCCYELFYWWKWIFYQIFSSSIFHFLHIGRTLHQTFFKEKIVASSTLKRIFFIIRFIFINVSSNSFKFNLRAIHNFKKKELSN